MSRGNGNPAHGKARKYRCDRYEEPQALQLGKGARRNGNTRKRKGKKTRNTRKRKGKKDKNMREMEKKKTRNSVQCLLSIYCVLHDLRGDSSNYKE